MSKTEAQRLADALEMRGGVSYEVQSEAAALLLRQDELLKRAQEALERFGDHDHQCPQYPTHSEPERYPPCSCGYEAVVAAIRALREAK